MSDTHAFGARLRQLRQAADLTQERLAEAVGCASETIRSFERGRRRPSRQMAQRMARILGLEGEQEAAFLRLARAATTPSDPEPPPSVATPPLPPPLLPAVLPTKLHRPRPRPDLLLRSRLLNQLDSTQRPLILLIAPAGFGKTTLLASWLAAHQSASEPDPIQPEQLKVSWLTLDQADCDPSQFVRGWIAALQQLAPQYANRVGPLLHGGQPPALDALLPLLATDLALLPIGSVLVLDDYHVIDAPAIHQALAVLIEQIPPQLRLVLASRVDPPLPLGRWRARGWLTELRAAELRFTLAEATAFFAQHPSLSLQAADVAALEQRTEGWAVGLQLAALALQQRPDPHAFVQRFAGSNRFVVDYLTEEVLDRLPAHLHNFVLQTSILEPFCGPLCDYLLGLEPEPTIHGQAAYSQLLLHELERANIFLVPLDDERHWYRYHHLFGEVVQARLRYGTPPHQLAGLHQRASHWYAQAGMEAQALRHARAAGDWTQVATLLIRLIPKVVGEGQFHTGFNWLANLPAAVLQDYPVLLIYQAGVAMYLNRVNEARAALDQADAALNQALPAHVSADEVQLLRGQAAVIRGAVYRILGDLAGCVAQSRLALELLPNPEPTPLKLRPLAMLNALRAFKVTGETSAAAEQQLEAVFSTLQTTGNRFALLSTIISLARMRTIQGRLYQAEATYQRALDLVSEPDELHALVGGAAYYIGRAELYREWDDQVQAANLFQRGLALAHGSLTVDADVITMGYLGLARLQRARNDLAAAQQALERFLVLAREREFAAHLLSRALAEQAVVHAQAGALLRAVAWADTVTPELVNHQAYLREDEQASLARVRLAQARAGDRDALPTILTMLDGMVGRALAAQRHQSSIGLLVQRAMVREVRADRPGALQDLEQALALAAPEGFRRSFLDHGPLLQTLLQATQATGLGAAYRATLLAGWT